MICFALGWFDFKFMIMSTYVFELRFRFLSGLRMSFVWV